MSDEAAPLAEERRIVAKVEQRMALVDALQERRNGSAGSGQGAIPDSRRTSHPQSR